MRLQLSLDVSIETLNLNTLIVLYLQILHKYIHSVVAYDHLKFSSIYFTQQLAIIYCHTRGWNAPVPFSQDKRREWYHLTMQRR